MKRALYFLLVIIGVTSCAHRHNKSEQDLASLREADKNWALASESRNLDSFMRFYDPDAYFANKTPIKGLANLRKFWEENFSTPDYFLTWKLDNILISASGDLGYTSGVWQQKYTENGKSVESGGRYLAIWHKQPDGSWKVLVDKP